eukprot:363958-Chlamydomonas_euryale.AAC.2
MPVIPLLQEHPETLALTTPHWVAAPPRNQPGTTQEWPRSQPGTTQDWLRNQPGTTQEWPRNQPGTTQE